MLGGRPKILNKGEKPSAWKDLVTAKRKTFINLQQKMNTSRGLHTTLTTECKLHK